MLLNPLSMEMRYRSGLPVLPGAFPVVGHTPSMYFDSIIDLLKWGQKQAGNLFWMDWGVGCSPLIYLGRDCIDLLKSSSVSTSYFSKLPDLFGRTMLALDGRQHSHIRSAMNTAFTPKNIAQTGLGAQMAGIVSETVSGWLRKGDFGALAETQDLSLNIIFGAMGIDGSELPTWRKNFHALVMGSIKVPGLAWAYSSKQAVRWLDMQLRQMASTARQGLGKQTLIKTLVESRDETGASLSDDELIGNLSLLVLAGYETTASAMAWALIEMARQPELWSMLCREVLSSPNPRIPTSLAEAKSLTWSEALFRESVRLYNPVALMLRQLTESTSIQGHVIPKGTLVALSPALMGRDRALYPDPDRCDPDRWLARGVPPTAVELIPFGAGHHFCLGYHFAWLETVQMLSAVAIAMGQRGLRPQLVDGAAPKQIFIPLAHPSPRIRLRFVPGLAVAAKHHAVPANLPIECKVAS